MTPYTQSLQKAIRDLHGCESVHIKTEPVTEKFVGRIVWEGEVEKFGLIGHPQARFCYAWSYQDDDGKEHYTAVLGVPAVDSAQAAVRASIVAQVKNERKET
jgi:hypothetical protein